MNLSTPVLASAPKTDQIIAATRSLFVRYGYRRTSVDDIAREAGVAKATLYLHFSGKEEMFREMIRRFQLAQEQRCASAETTTGPLERRVTAFLDAVYGTALSWFGNSEHIEELKSFAAGEATIPTDDPIRIFGQRLALLLQQADAAGEVSLARAGQSASDVATTLFFAAYGAKHATGATLESFHDALPGIVYLILAGITPAG
ncbi:TetR/AcrR family transcriptional regulator [Sphingobium sp. Sx8-8]|uniref:TetR/AcrR family transcriptional regulator n=1 Tax=Sphingobium sp. Sx8-8 TaxID=2933617 RepID=UPI001F5808A9|nr:TetR/AcrR family transcriptional regulator [Sphingobium sp. Sx8-8]